jgi:hypothetical protein
MYELLYNVASKESDYIVVSNVHVVHEDGKEEDVRYDDVQKEALINSILLPMDASNNPNKISKSVWHSIYRKTLLDKYDIRFEDRRVFFEEDTLFNLKSMIYANDIGFCDEVLYVWDKHYDSESNKWPTEISEKQINSVTYMASLLFQSCTFNLYKDSLYQLFSEEIKVYYPMYNVLQGELRIRFSSLIREIRFPLLGRYDLKFLSRKRIKLFFFILKVKYFG